MELTVVEEGGMKAVEGEVGMPFLTGPEDVDRLLEACFAAGARSALMYAANLPPVGWLADM